MKGTNFNIPILKPRVLLAPLDWGLGHATRCIPIIFKLQEQNCDIIIAAEAAGKSLLQKEFPDLIFIELKGYRIQYSHNKLWLPIILALQFPKLLYRIYAENRWLKKMVIAHQIDAVIADNRLGLSHKKIPCIYITHQLKIKTGNYFTELLAQKIHYHFINKYSTCWIPDAAGKINLAGELSHPEVLPKVPAMYLGPFSRFEKKEVDIKYDLCILLSGPEPQRSIFEKIILTELKKYKGSVILIRGLPGILTEIELNINTVEIKNHLPAADLNQVLLQSKLIISRSGYTTVMDLIKLQKRAILVPTPGQTEQEYIAGYLHEQHIFYCDQQEHFSLMRVLEKVAGLTFNIPVLFKNDFAVIIEDFVKNSLKKN